MEDLWNGSGSADIGQYRLEIIVHLVRVVIKTGMISALLLGRNIYTFPLVSYILLSEIADQISLFAARRKESLKKWARLFYVVNSVTLISVVAYLADWSLNDFYLVYAIHISSSMLTYGLETGLLSFTLSIVSYSLLLWLNHAPLEIYLRLPLLSVLSLRFFVNQAKYERASNLLTTVISLEKSKKDFIAIASHNLRTPVAAIYGYIELLLRGEAGALNDEQAVFIDRIKSNNRKLEQLTEQLLQISILEVGEEINLLKQPSQIEIIIRDVIENYEPTAKIKGLTLTFEKERSLLPLVNIDAEKIKTVLSNLVDNAVKYTETGGVTVSARREGDFVIVAVKDTGAGIRKEDLPKLFSKFYRSGDILVYNKVGTGLGLYIGRQIIELHGGKIGAESVEGRGSTFRFSLPIMKDEELQ